MMTIFRRFLAAWRNWINPEPSTLLEKPPLVYIDPLGQGWTRPPDYQDATAADEGQNDVWKRDLRFCLWRYTNDMTEPGTFSLRDAGLSKYADFRDKGPLFPVGSDLACACRRLGFARLARATGLGVAAHEIADFHRKNDAAVRVEAEAQYARNLETAKTWTSHAAFTHDTVEQTISMFTLGPIGAHADAVPMRTFVPVGETEAAGPAVASVTGSATGPATRVTSR